MHGSARIYARPLVRAGVWWPGGELSTDFVRLVAMLFKAGCNAHNAECSGSSKAQLHRFTSVVSYCFQPRWNQTGNRSQQLAASAEVIRGKDVPDAAGSSVKVAM